MKGQTNIMETGTEKSSLKQLVSWIMSVWPLLIALIAVTAGLAELRAQVAENQRDISKSEQCLEYIRRQNEMILKDVANLSGDVKMVRKLLEIRGYRVAGEE